MKLPLAEAKGSPVVCGLALRRQGLERVGGRVTSLLSPHLHWLLLASIIVLSLLVLPAALWQVGVIGQSTQQG